MKLKNNHKFVLAADGSGASGKTTGAKIISRKYGLKFLSSGLLYRFASHQLLKYKPKNKVNFLKSKFKKLNYSKLNKIGLHSSKISEYTRKKSVGILCPQLLRLLNLTRMVTLNGILRQIVVFLVLKRILITIQLQQSILT